MRVENTSAFAGWLEGLVAGVLSRRRASAEDLLAVLRAADSELPVLLQAAFQVRERHWGRRVKLCALRNARSGMCAEDCHYCSQSAVSAAAVPRYPLQSTAALVEGARRAVAAGARRYCMAASGRGPSPGDVEDLCAAASRIRAAFPNLEICMSLGFLTEDQARKLKGAGVRWINHNLNTSVRFYAQICSTHTYADRVATVRHAARAGLRVCCGLIAGMGETDEDLVDVALALRDLRVDALPVNFLCPIEGTPLASRRALTPPRCLRVLCMVRFANPTAEVRVAGGREVNLGWFQALAVYPANSIFVDGYLTTPGQAASEARRMVEEMGFEVEVEAAEAPAA